MLVTESTSGKIGNCKYYTRKRISGPTNYAELESGKVRIITMGEGAGELIDWRLLRKLPIRWETQAKTEKRMSSPEFEPFSIARQRALLTTELEALLDDQERTTKAYQHDKCGKTVKNCVDMTQRD